MLIANIIIFFRSASLFTFDSQSLTSVSTDVWATRLRDDETAHLAICAVTLINIWWSRQFFRAFFFASHLESIASQNSNFCSSSDDRQLNEMRNIYAPIILSSFILLRDTSGIRLNPIERAVRSRILSQLVKFENYKNTQPKNSNSLIRRAHK